MTLSLNEFGKTLTTLGLLTAAELKTAWDAIPQTERPRDADAFGKQLIALGKLTSLQAARVLAGQGESLVMGEYLLLAEIGAGGMGNVYRARHRRMDRIVALKVISAGAMKDEAAVKRFQREVQAAAKLSHPNIVTAYDAGEANKQHYLVMQYVDGGDLFELVRRDGPLPVDRALGFIIQAARGLEYAHAEGIVHRDIKPANLLVDKKGTVRILDMGLARFDDGSDGLTTTEQVMGTVDYMSPEQATDSSRIDGRTDTYALGCTLWYLLTGKKLYQGDSVVSRIMAHREAPLPSLMEVRDDAPWALEQALHKMIAKSPQDRWQSMAEVIDALESCRSQSSGVAMGSSVLTDKDFASFLQGMGSMAGSSTLGKRGAPSKVGGKSGSKIDAKSGSASKVATKSKTPSTTDTDAVLRAEATTQPAPPKLPRAKALGSAFPSTQSAAEAAALDEVIADDGAGDPLGRRLSLKWIGATSALVAACALAAFLTLRNDEPEADAETAPIAAAKVKPAFAKAPFDAATASRLQKEWAAYLALPVEQANAAGLKMRVVPPGEYMMGSPPEEIASVLGQINNPSDEAKERIGGEKLHRVVISTPMLVATTETTIGQFRKFVEAEKYVTLKEQEILERNQNWSTWQKPVASFTDDSPVTELTWQDAVMFCNWLSQRENLKAAYTFHLTLGWMLEGGDGYRLPTEAQWEYACRAGTTTKYFCADDPTTVREHIWYSGNNPNRYPAVGSKQPNAFGLFDMLGGVQEWCNDAYHANWYAISPTIDPEAPGDGDRVVRGGHRTAQMNDIRSARRGKEWSRNKNSSLGFRVFRVFHIPGLYEAS